MAVTWDQLTFLTPAQQTKAAQFAVIGQAVTAFQTPDLSTVTQSQAKAAEALLRTLIDLVGPAQIGIHYARKTFEDAALKAFQDANP